MGALRQYAGREGHCRVPAAHVENFENQDVNLGAWVGYARQRQRRGMLSADRANEISSVPGWQWGPLKPGPMSDQARNAEIFKMREAGQSLREIAFHFNLSRQRVHQIVNSKNG